MRNIIYLVLGITSVICMGALTKATMRTLALPHWRVDANISGANPDLGSSSQASYIGVFNSSLTLTNNSGNGVLTAQIPCSSTNAPSGTTCSAGSESVGVAFTIPADGCAVSGACDVRACASFGHVMITGAAGAIELAFQLVETPANAQTISQEGKSRVESRIAASNTLGLPVMVCGTFTFTSAGQKVLRLMYEQTAAGSITANVITGDAEALVGQRDIHWEVYPILSY